MTIDMGTPWIWMLWTQEGPHGQEYKAVGATEVTKNERDVEGKTYATIVENLDIGLWNTTASPNDYI